MAGDMVRLSVNLNSETAAALRTLMERKGISATEAVRRAISFMDYMDAQTRVGRRLQTVSKSGRAIKEIVLT